MLKILLALAGKHFGMTAVEMGEEADVSESTVMRYIKALEECGVELVRQRELDDHGGHGWHYIYRLRTIRGVKLDLTRRAQ